MKELHKSDESVSYEQILDDTNQLIQISDLEFQMQYANRPARMFTNHENRPYKGEKCYKYMMGLDEQCPFCPMRNIGQRESYIGEIDNGTQVFTVKTKRICWEGKDAFVEFATDITEIKRAQQIYESQMQTLLQSIPEAQGIFHLNLSRDKVFSMNGMSPNVSRLNDRENVDKLIHQIGEYIPEEDMKEKFRKRFSLNALVNAYKSGKTEIVQEVLSYYEDKSIRWTRMTARLIENPKTGELECILYGMDIQEEKKYLERIEDVEKEREVLIEKTKRDVLTGAYSKKTFYQMTESWLERHEKEAFAIIFMDLDNFKCVNDTLGHLAGDRVLIGASRMLQETFGTQGIVSRFGGDEFCALVKYISYQELIEKLDILLDAMQMDYRDEQACVKSSASIGVVFRRQADYGDSGHIIKALIARADEALYKAKRNGRNQYYIDEIQEFTR